MKVTVGEQAHSHGCQPLHTAAVAAAGIPHHEIFYLQFSKHSHKLILSNSHSNSTRLEGQE